MNKHFATIVVVLNGIIIFCFLGLRGWLPPAPEKIEESFEHRKVEASRCRNCTTATDLSVGDEKRDGRIDNNPDNFKCVATGLTGINESAKQFEFETSHLYFKELQMSDADDIYHYMINPKMAERISWQPYQSKLDTRVMVNSLLSKNQISYYSPFIPWAVVNKETNTVIGTALLSEYSPKEPKCSIEYTLDSAYWNSPYELEVIRALIEVGFVVLNCSCVSARAECDYPYISAMLEKAGMSFEGTQPDYKYINNQYFSYNSYSLLRKTLPAHALQKSVLKQIEMIEEHD